MALQDLIQNSSLSQSQKSFWEEKIKNVSETEQKAYLALFQNWPDDVLWATESLMEAEEAREKKDMEKYNKIKKGVAEKLNEILK